MRELGGPVFVEALGATPVIVPNLDAIPPQPRFSEVKSMTVGPHARIVGYGDKLFREPVLELAPGTRLADTSEVAFHERVQSFHMECVA